MLTAVIPTRNRPDDLVKAVVSVREQIRQPEELIIVDQSIGDESRNLIEDLMSDCEFIKLVYIHDPVISGLVEAKRVAAEKAEGDIICFLEDDVILSPNYLEQIELGFKEKSNMLGCSGVITNFHNPSTLYRYMHGLFFQGIFKDPRPKLFIKPEYGSEKIVLSDVLCGGLSAWKKEVLSTIPFDVENEFFMFEDMEFSTRVVEKYGHRLYINQKAQLEHHCSTVNRDPHGLRQKRKLTESILFYKKRAGWHGAKRGLAFALIWWFAESVLRAIKTFSIMPVRGYIQGILTGISKKVVG
jgi:GT2 family glycosyltransferase